jgi:hypothetical protein
MRGFILVVNLIDHGGECSRSECFDLLYLCLVSDCITFVFDAAGEALHWAARHLDHICLLSNLRVVVAKLVVPKNHTLLSQTSDCKLGALRVMVIVEDKVGDVDNDPCFIGCTIDIVDWVGFMMGHVEMLFDPAYSMSMKHPVVLQSMRAWVYHLTAISVNLISTLMASDINPGLAATTYLPGI